MRSSVELGPALARWNDYVGTAAADDPEVEAGARSLYETAGLDPDRWLVLAVDLTFGGDREEVVLYAFDREPYGVRSHADLLELAQENGQLPVSAVRVAAGAIPFSRAAFAQLTVRLTARGVSEQRLTVVAEASPEPAAAPEHRPGHRGPAPPS